MRRYGVIIRCVSRSSHESWIIATESCLLKFGKYPGDGCLLTADLSQCRLSYKIPLYGERDHPNSVLIADARWTLHFSRHIGMPHVGYIGERAHGICFSAGVVLLVN